MKAFAEDKLKYDSKIEVYLGKSRKHCGKRIKCWYLYKKPPQKSG